MLCFLSISSFSILSQKFSCLETIKEHWRESGITETRQIFCLFLFLPKTSAVSVSENGLINTLVLCRIITERYSFFFLSH